MNIPVGQGRAASSGFVRQGDLPAKTTLVQ